MFFLHFFFDFYTSVFEKYIFLKSHNYAVVAYHIT